MLAVLILFTLLMVSHWALTASKQHRAAAACAFAKVPLALIILFMIRQEASAKVSGFSSTVLYVLFALVILANIAAGLKSLRDASAARQTPDS